MNEKTGFDCDLGDGVFDNPIAAGQLPRTKMPENSSPSYVIEELIGEELQIEGNTKQNLCTFCTTWSEKSVHALLDMSMDKNIVDKDEYPRTADFEARCIHMIANLWNSPTPESTLGCSTCGSSEAAMLGGLAMKWKWRQSRERAGLDCSKPNLVCGSVQICWHKFAKYFDVELREVPISTSDIAITPETLEEYVDENTIGVVATLGVTYTGVYEPIEAISHVLDRIQAENSWDIPIHVDGASGGFIAPFIHETTVWDFRLDRVKSINASGHKFGLAPLGIGWIVWRTLEDLPQDLVFHVDYLGGNMPTFGLNFSRPGGQVIAQYYNFLRLGFDGYRRIQQSCADVATYLAEELKQFPAIKILYDGRGGLPAVSYTLSKSTTGYNLYDLSDRLRMKGWQIASYEMPANRETTVIQRIIIRRGITHEIISLLLDDMKAAIEYLNSNPVKVSDETTLFNHN